MANEKQKLEYADAQFNTRTVLTGLWITLILLYIYCDFFTLIRTGEIEGVIAGNIGPFTITQLFLALASLTTVIPSLMIITCLFLKLPYLRLINIIGGIVFTIVNIGNLAGETWAYYWIYGSIELLITVVITVKSIKWPHVQHNGVNV